MDAVKIKIFLFLFLFANISWANYETYNSFLKKYVNQKGLVNYQKLKRNSGELTKNIKDIQNTKISEYTLWNKNKKIAFWINAYNLSILNIIISHYPITNKRRKSILYPANSIQQISKVWKIKALNIFKKTLSVDEIEHQILRKKFNEPRIHFALVCAALSCPPLRTEPYIGKTLNTQLNQQVQKFLSIKNNFYIDKQKNTLIISSILKWFGGDFIKSYYNSNNLKKYSKKENAILNFFLHYLSPSEKAYIQNNQPKIKYKKYNWTLNEQ